MNSLDTVTHKKIFHYLTLPESAFLKCKS